MDLKPTTITVLLDNNISHMQEPSSSIIVAFGLCPSNEIINILRSMLYTTFNQRFIWHQIVLNGSLVTKGVLFHNCSLHYYAMQFLAVTNRDKKPNIYQITQELRAIIRFFFHLIRGFLFYWKFRGSQKAGAANFPPGFTIILIYVWFSDYVT